MNVTLFSSIGGALLTSFTLAGAVGGVCFDTVDGGVSRMGEASTPFGVLLPELPPSDSASAQMKR